MNTLKIDNTFNLNTNKSKYFKFELKNYADIYKLIINY